MSQSKPSLSFFSLLITLLVFSGCASQQPQPQPAPLPVPPVTYGPEAPVATPVPPPNEVGTGTPIPSESIPIPGEEYKKEGITVALVLGGAGVASFATVGILKRLSEEKIRVQLIVTTGWPTLFSLGYGFFRSVHDLEWFASNLKEKDFYNVGIFESEKDFADHDKLSGMVAHAFKQTDLSECRVPVVISAANTELGEPEIFDRGEWKTPLLKTMSVPGIYRPYPAQEEAGWVSSLTGIDVNEAIRRQASVVVAVEMYGDYFDFVQRARKDSSDRVFRKLYLNRLKSELGKQMQQATVTGRIVLNKAPGDFSQKRAAILAGYKEGIRLSKLIRQALNPKRP